MINPLKLGRKKSLSKEEKKDPLWAIIKIPIFILIVYSIFTNILPRTFYNSYAFSIGFIGFILNISMFASIGYYSIKYLKDSKFALKSGAFAGAIIGIVVAIFGLILVYFFPERFSDTIVQLRIKLAELGLSPDLSTKLLRISSWISLFLGTLFNAIFGALIAWISALIFKKRA